jgi:hypothetical protein
MSALVWKNNRRFGFLEAKVNGERDRYVISYERERFHVWHKDPERLLGEAATLDAAKTIAQAHADQGQKKPAAAA